MQNTVRWHSNQFQATHIWNPWSNETDGNLEDPVCTVRVYFCVFLFVLTNVGTRKTATRYVQTPCIMVDYCNHWPTTFTYLIVIINKILLRNGNCTTPLPK